MRQRRSLPEWSWRRRRREPARRAGAAAKRMTTKLGNDDAGEGARQPLRFSHTPLDWIRTFLDQELRLKYNRRSGMIAAGTMGTAPTGGSGVWACNSKALGYQDLTRDVKGVAGVRHTSVNSI